MIVSAMTAEKRDRTTQVVVICSIFCDLCFYGFYVVFLQYAEYSAGSVNLEGEITILG